MLNDSQKTVPFRLSSAELETYRLLRKKMNPSASEEKDESAERLQMQNDRHDTESGRFSHHKDQ